MHPRLEYEIAQWKPRALKRAKSLEGRPRTSTEQEVFEKHGQDGYFRTFGIQPETQKYVDYTIQMLEKPVDAYEYLGMWSVASVRLQWSCKNIYNHTTN